MKREYPHTLGVATPYHQPNTPPHAVPGISSTDAGVKVIPYMPAHITTNVHIHQYTHTHTHTHHHTVPYMATHTCMIHVYTRPYTHASLCTNSLAHISISTIMTKYEIKFSLSLSPSPPWVYTLSPLYYFPYPPLSPLNTFTTLIKFNGATETYHSRASGLIPPSPSILLFLCLYQVDIIVVM